MRYVCIPEELPIRAVRASDSCLSPGRYETFIPPAQNSASHFAPLDKLVVFRKSQIKAKKDAWYLYAEIGDIDVATGGVSFRKLRGYQLPTRTPRIAQFGDVLISSVRTYRRGIGYVSSEEENQVTTNAVINICGVTDHAPGMTLLYVYSFLRSDFFVAQVWSLLNRGVYPRMDRGALNKIRIPIPSETKVIQYVSTLMQVIVDKEKEIRRRDASIGLELDREIGSNQRPRASFCFEFPDIGEIKRVGRLDTGMYERHFKETMFRIENYTYGTGRLVDFGLFSRRGPNLAVSVSGRSIYSETQLWPNYYRLVLPEHISEFRTIGKEMWLGNPRNLEALYFGDILFSARGDMGRTVILAESPGKATTNFDGIMINSKGTPRLSLNIYIGLMLDHYRRIGLLETIGHGSGAASFTSAHLEELPFPRVHDKEEERIAHLYHNPVSPPAEPLTLNSFVDRHRRWNGELGIWELDREMKLLQGTLADVQEKIIAGETVSVPM